jgi:ribose transport system ATP-binding protein
LPEIRSEARRAALPLLARRIAEAGGTVPNTFAAPALTLRGLTKRYGETVALDNVSIDFAPGSIHTILGENGSGKSTVLKLLSGVVQPTAGEIRLGDTAVHPGSPREVQALGFGTVFQEVLIAPHRSVLQNIFLGVDGFLKRGVPLGCRRGVATAVLGAIGQQAVDLDQPAGTLPLAAQQVVVIARTLVRLPRILLLDEVTAALDYADRDNLFETIEDYARAGSIVIFISHRMEEVRRLSDRVTVLRSGRVTETVERERVSGDVLLRLMMPDAHVA